MAWTQKCREILEVTGQISLETPAPVADALSELDAASSSAAAAPAAAATTTTTVKRTASRKN